MDTVTCTIYGHSHATHNYHQQASTTPPPSCAPPPPSIQCSLVDDPHLVYLSTLSSPRHLTAFTMMLILTLRATGAFKE